MKELDECLNLKRKINEINDKIRKIELMTKSPKSQIITGMPRSNNIENSMEKYLIKIEKLEQEKEDLISCLNEKWDNNFQDFLKVNLSIETIELLYLRFYKGLPWKICVARLRKKYNNNKWNENKAFRLYGNAVKILKKIEKF